MFVVQPDVLRYTLLYLTWVFAKTGESTAVQNRERLTCFRAESTWRMIVLDEWDSRFLYAIHGFVKVASCQRSMSLVHIHVPFARETLISRSQNRQVSTLSLHSRQRLIKFRSWIGFEPLFFALYTNKNINTWKRMCVYTGINAQRPALCSIYIPQLLYCHLT